MGANKSTILGSSGEWYSSLTNLDEGEAYDGHRGGHHTAGEEDGVGQVVEAVPDTLQVLVVEHVVCPPHQTRK